VRDTGKKLADGKAHTGKKNSAPVSEIEVALRFGHLLGKYGATVDQALLVWALIDGFAKMAARAINADNLPERT
jgi:hypothetical protein